MLIQKNGEKLDLMEKVHKYIKENLQELYEKANGGGEVFKERKMDEFADSLIAQAESIIKKKTCKLRHKSLDLLRTKCAKDVRFDVKA